MNDLIKALMENEKPFGLMSEEMQAKAKEISGYGHFKWLNDDNEWEYRRNLSFANSYTYRLRADYEPAEDEYELIEIVDEEGALKYLPKDNDEVRWLITQAQADANFAGYLYEDGKVRTVSVVLAGESVNYGAIMLKGSRKFVPIRPTHCVFLKGPVE